MIENNTLMAIWGSAVVGALAADAIKGEVNKFLWDIFLGKLVTAAVVAALGLFLIVVIMNFLKIS